MNIVKYKALSIKNESFSKKQKIIGASLIGSILVSSLIISFFTTDKLQQSPSKYFNFLNIIIGKRTVEGDSTLSLSNYGNTFGILWVYFSNLFITLFMISILCFPQFITIALIVIPIISFGIIFTFSKFFILFPFHHDDQIQKLKITNWISIGSMALFFSLFLLNLKSKIPAIVHTSIHTIVLMLLYYYGNYQEKPVINSGGPNTP